MSVFLLSILAAGLIAPRDQNIVSPAWLEQNLSNPNVVVVEIGSSGTAPTAGNTIHRASWPFGRHPHIPGARWMPIESIVVRNGWPPDELPPVEKLQQAFVETGIGDADRIIIYSDNPLWATRAWFTLDALGHGDRAAILDGGFGRWKAEERPIETTRLQYAAKTFTPRPDATRVLEHAAVRAAFESDDVALIDARPRQQFDGVERGQRVVRGGHIPGAECHPWQANLTPDGSFRPLAELQNDYEALVGSPQKRVIVYCRTGMEASMPYFVLRSLGYDVVLYDGSYTEWARDKAVPVTTMAGTR